MLSPTDRRFRDTGPYFFFFFILLYFFFCSLLLLLLLSLSMYHVRFLARRRRQRAIRLRMARVKDDFDHGRTAPFRTEKATSVTVRALKD